MAWNEPGGNKDPWGNKGNQNDGPPDLDEVIQNIQKKFGGLFGGGSSNNGGDAEGGGGLGPTGLVVIIALVGALWLLTGFYIIEPAQRGVILQFGAQKEVTDPGLNWHIPYPIQTLIKLNVDELSSLRHKAKMLTEDENIVDIELTVQYKIEQPTDYLFQDQNPNKTMQDATESIVREVIGKNKLDYIMTDGRGKISDDIRLGIQGLLLDYKTGLAVTSINMQPAKPPEEVKEAFDDAIKSREDKARLENQAEAYANEVVPLARGKAARQVADAEAYKSKVIAEAEGEVSRFNAVLKQYEAAKDVTRTRIYIETVEEVLSNTSKVLLDANDGNNLMYIPLDKMMKSSQNNGNARSISGSVEPMNINLTPTAGQSRADRGRNTR